MPKHTIKKLPRNDFGNVDITNGIPKGLVHITEPRIQPTCRKLGIDYAKALVGFKKLGSRYYPKTRGIVIWAKDERKLAAEIARKNSPEAVANREAQRERRENSRRKKCCEVGIRVGSRTESLLNRGKIDKDEAELMGFRAHYRHRHSDYDERFPDQGFRQLQASGHSPQEAAEEIRTEARASKVEDPIPRTWSKYLSKYGFNSPVAKALATVLKSPRKCHPVWFKEAEIAVRRNGLDLATLTYEVIRDAIQGWRWEQEADRED